MVQWWACTMAAEIVAMATAPFSASVCTELGRRKEWREWWAVDGVAAFRRSRPDRWAHGQRMGTTVCPCSSHSLRPVGHFHPLVRFELQHLQQCVATLQHYETKNNSTLSVLYLLMQAEYRGVPIDKVWAWEILYNFVSMSQV
jgi:GTP cyclohydrolase FolE2